MRERAREDPTKLKEQAAQKKKHDEAYRARHQESLRIKQQLRRLDKYWLEHRQHRPLAETRNYESERRWRAEDRWAAALPSHIREK
ncbi:hypothetical protein B0H16DRAFT_1746518 [Mycena metata]|uniref:Uncharacterized protein n=1 Tax=Mycena metata TaxID=1033252 RepID=A0AAD7MA11_9AGAR|nr:hypothetical protein B0H16DRAFT_1746518 [Mycena metata]